MFSTLPEYCIYYLMKLKMRVFMKILMLEKRNSTNFYLFTITVARFGQNIHSMAIADHKVRK